MDAVFKDPRNGGKTRHLDVTTPNLLNDSHCSGDSEKLNLDSTFQKVEDVKHKT